MTQTSPEKRSTGLFLLLGWLLAAAYAITSIFAMNDLWKCYVDNNMGYFTFGDPARFCNSGMMYLYITFAFLTGSLLMFGLRWRANNSGSKKIPAILATMLILVACFFYFKPSPGNTFMEYIEMRFYPFWSFTLASFFVVKWIVATGKKV